ncbi:MAG: hypothetical protein KGO49_10790 [Gammaproteobacteria bacterium]|nr:hypothetical protein [Gammaproteobacteria bacterium]
MTTFNTVLDEPYVAPQIDLELDRFCLQLAIEGASPYLSYANKIEFLMLTFKNKRSDFPKSVRLLLRLELTVLIEKIQKIRGRLQKNFVNS